MSSFCLKYTDIPLIAPVEYQLKPSGWLAGPGTLPSHISAVSRSIIFLLSVCHTGPHSAPQKQCHSSLPPDVSHTLLVPIHLACFTLEYNSYIPIFRWAISDMLPHKLMVLCYMHLYNKLCFFRADICIFNIHSIKVIRSIIIV